MKKIFLIISLFFISNYLSAQTNEIRSLNINNFSINSREFGSFKLYKINDKLNIQLVKKDSIPMFLTSYYKSEKDDSFRFEESFSCYVSFLSKFEIISDLYTLTINNEKIKVGDTITKLKDYKVNSSKISFVVKHISNSKEEYLDGLLTLEYNPVDNKITKMTYEDIDIRN